MSYSGEGHDFSDLVAAFYDSSGDTKEHIAAVRSLMNEIKSCLSLRDYHHDKSKLSDEEKPIFDEYTPKLKESTYGSKEYKRFLKEMKPALDHHYRFNSHHPEHYSNGIDGMSLIDVIEMLADWKAATERHDNGDILTSLKINRKRFSMSDQLYRILKNTVKELEWDK